MPGPERLPRHLARSHPFTQHPFDKRLEVGDHIELGVELSTDPFHRDQRLAEQNKVGWKLYLMFLQYFDELGQQASGVEQAQGNFVVFVDKFAQFPFQLAAVGLIGNFAGKEKLMHDVIDIAFGQRYEQVDKLVLERFIEVADHAEIEHGDIVFRQDEQVAGVRITMKKTELQDLLEENVGSPLGDDGEVIPLLLEPVKIVDLDPLEITHGDHGSAGVVPVNLRDAEGAVVLEVLPEAVNGVALAAEVELAVDNAAEFADDGDRVGDHVGLDMVFDQVGQPGQDVQVGLEGLPYFRAPDLDDDILSRWQCRPVNLGDRRCRQRFGIEFSKQLPGCFAEFRLDDLLDRFDFFRRHIVLQLAEFLGIFARDQVGAGRYDLSQLDEGGAELLHRQAQPFRNA